MSKRLIGNIQYYPTGRKKCGSPAEFVFESPGRVPVKLILLYHLRSLAVSAVIGACSVVLISYFDKDDGNSIVITEMEFFHDKTQPDGCSHYISPHDDTVCNAVPALYSLVETPSTVYTDGASSTIVPFIATIDAISPLVVVASTIKSEKEKLSPFHLLELYSVSPDSNKVYNAVVVLKDEALVMAELLMPSMEVIVFGKNIRWTVPDCSEIASHLHGSCNAGDMNGEDHCFARNRIPGRVYLVQILKDMKVIGNPYELPPLMQLLSSKVSYPHSNILCTVRAVLLNKLQLFLATQHCPNGSTKTIKLVLTYYPHNIPIERGCELICMNVQPVYSDGGIDGLWGYIASMRSSIMITKFSPEQSQHVTSPFPKNQHLVGRHFHLDYNCIILKYYLAKYLQRCNVLDKGASSLPGEILNFFVQKSRGKRNLYLEFFLMKSYRISLPVFLHIEELYPFCLRRAETLLEDCILSEGRTYVNYFIADYQMCVQISHNRIVDNGRSSLPFICLDKNWKYKPNSGEDKDRIYMVRLQYVSLSIVFLANSRDSCEGSATSTRSIVIANNGSLYMVMPHLFGTILYESGVSEDNCRNDVPPTYDDSLDQGDLLLVRQRLKYAKISKDAFTFAVDLSRGEVINRAKIELNIGDGLAAVLSALHSVGTFAREVVNLASAYYTIYYSANSTLLLGGWDEYFSDFRNTKPCPRIRVEIQSTCADPIIQFHDMSTTCLINEESLDKLSREDLVWAATANVRHYEGIPWKNGTFLAYEPNIVLSDLYLRKPDQSSKKTLYCVSGTCSVLSFVRCRIECTKCFSPLTNTTDGNLAREKDDELLCPNMCSSKYYEPIWNLSTTLDDGSAQVKLYAERGCAVKLLGMITKLDAQMISLIESVCKRLDGGVIYNAGIPPTSLMRYRVRCLSTIGKKRKLSCQGIESAIRVSYGLPDEDSTDETLANYFLQRCCRNIKLVPISFQFKLSGNAAKNTLAVTQSNADFCLSISQCANLSRSGMSTFSQTAIRINMLDCCRMDNRVEEQSIQNMLEMLES